MAPIPETRRKFEAALRDEGKAFARGRCYQLLEGVGSTPSERAVSWCAEATADNPLRSLGGSPKGTREEAIGWAVRDAGLA